MGVSDQCQRGEEEEEGSWRSQGEGRRCLQGKSAGLSAGDVPMSHDKELEEVSNPAYPELACKEVVHKINPRNSWSTPLDKFV